MTAHATMNREGRLKSVGINPEEIFPRIKKVAQNYESVAILVTILAQPVENEGTEVYWRHRFESNGEQVWAICRQGKIITWMFRRNNQPTTLEALRVKAITALEINLLLSILVV